MSDLPSDRALSKRSEVLRSLALGARLRRAFRCTPGRIGVLVVGLCLLSACSKKKVEIQNLQVNPDSLYSVRTLSLNTLISDSGLIRYRMTAPELLVYERSDRNEWVFPKGLLLRPYDTTQSQIFIKADSAIRRPQHEEWELIGHVIVQGPQGQRLTTRRLFWLRDERRLYSNDTTNFLVQGRELRGSHFNAKDDLSWYEIYDNKGTFEFEEKPLGQGSAPASSQAPTSSTTQVTATADSLRRAPGSTKR